MKPALKPRVGSKTVVNNEQPMNLTLLLDLDDTLLNTNMDDFLPVYFEELSGFLGDLVDPDKMMSALMAGSRKMMGNDDPSQTLQQLFDAEFFPLLGIIQERLQPRIDQFYEDVFPTLSSLTSPLPDAVAFVDWALEHGIRLAVATNPLFPITAIHQRMRWAGLPPEEIPFELVTANETFHFAKPNPAYFAEVLGRMGWPDGPVVMVGDDPRRDLVGSQTLGIPTFWISDAEMILPDGLEISGRGPISDLRPWLESADHSRLEPATFTPEALVALLLSAPAAISGLFSPWLDSSPVQANEGLQVDRSDLRRRPESNEWSLTEIICHLRDTESELNHERVIAIMEQDDPFIPAYATDDWAEERDYIHQDIQKALHDFTYRRKEIVDQLHGLKHEWERVARHAIFGPTNLLEVVKFIVEHDKLHIRQIWSTIQQLSQ